MIKIWGSLLVLAGICQTSFAQYYFQDHYTQQQSKQTFEILIKYKVSNIMGKSIEPTGEETADFSIDQQVVAAQKELRNAFSTSATGTSYLITKFNQNYLPIVNIDSTQKTVTTTEFKYNQQNNIQQAHSFASSTDQEYSYSEIRTYFYKDNGQLDYLTLVKNNTDTTIILFDNAENGQPGTETWFKNGVVIDNWYYYYNSLNQLTDVVHYYPSVNKMLPAYLMEYNNNGQLSSQTNIKSASNQYTIYQYTYDSRGIKTAESIFNKQKQQIGRIVYTVK